jgi:adenine-specific DNA-methyltransferase
MKFLDEVSDAKRRGGYYTPPLLALECFARLRDLAGNRPLHILEPAAGDGAFLRAVPQAIELFEIARPRFTCVELDEVEARTAEQCRRSLGIDGEVRHDSFFTWARTREGRFDAVLGNPPFVRYQFVPRCQRDDADRIFARHGKQLDGVANLWIPFVLISLELLRERGAFALILPGELFATKSAGLVRSELIRHFEKLRVDLYPRGFFPNLLQDVIVLSGRRTPRTASRRPVEFVEHGGAGRWRHTIADSRESWTRYLLSEAELGAYQAASNVAEMRRLREVAVIGVSIVTGANGFFTVDDRVAAEYGLERWARPLLGKTIDSPGLIFGAADHAALRAAGKKAWILAFSKEGPDPERWQRAGDYLRLGEAQGLPKRYKCRIREPWYRVPDVRADDLMMAKRAHQFHRLILNRARVHTTDTIYRGHMRPGFEAWRESLVAAFHNTLTILSSEIEGRSYGGGVLELVPSEIGRLVVPLVAMGEHLGALDRICRDAGGQRDTCDALIDATDQLLLQIVPKLAEFLPRLRSARRRLRGRRFSG